MDYVAKSIVLSTV